MYKVRNARNSLRTQFRLSTADAAKVAQCLRPGKVTACGLKNGSLHFCKLLTNNT